MLIGHLERFRLVTGSYSRINEVTFSPSDAKMSFLTSHLCWQRRPTLDPSVKEVRLLGSRRRAVSAVALILWNI